jgi:hypothetical protein
MRRLILEIAAIAQFRAMQETDAFKQSARRHDSQDRGRAVAAD